MNKELEALKILGAIPLQHPSKPHLWNLPPNSTMEDVRSAYRVLEQALIEFEELKVDIKNMLTLQSYHFVVLIKKSSQDKSIVYQEYENEIKQYNNLSEKLKEKE